MSTTTTPRHRDPATINALIKRFAPRAPARAPRDVKLTIAVRAAEHAVWDGHRAGEEPNPDAVEADKLLRQALVEELGFNLCQGRCRCSDFGENDYDLDPGEFCTGDWSGCCTDECEEALTYLDGMCESNVCRACHYSGACSDERSWDDACDGGCDVFGKARR